MKRFWLVSLSAVLALGVARSPSETSAIAVPPGQIERAVRSLDGIVRDMQAKSGVPGIAVAVVHDDKVVYLKGFGVRRVGAPARVDANTVFELASLSKPLGAAVVAGVVAQGRVRWSDPVVKYFPEFRLSDPYVTQNVTIADMYAHRSGLPDHAGDLLEDLGFDRTTIFQRLALLPLDPFRITYHYTNFGLTAAAQAVANSQQTSWENLSAKILYAPLRMTATSSRYADYARAANRAVLHVRIGKVWVAKFTRNADAQSPAGGASSTARDMAQWLRFELSDAMFDGKQIVAKAALLATQTPNLMLGPLSSPTSRATFYGLGMNVSYDEAGRLRLSHSGGFAMGGATALLMLPSEHLGIVVLTNGMPIGVPEAIASAFVDTAEFGKSQHDWYAGYARQFESFYFNPSELAGKTPPANARPQQTDAAYVGTYDNPYYGPVAVKIVDGRLAMMLGPRNDVFELTHWNGNTFSYEPTGENAVGISAVTFAIATGQAVAGSVTIEYLNHNKLGTFLRER